MMSSFNDFNKIVIEKIPFISPMVARSSICTIDDDDKGKDATLGRVGRRLLFRVYRQTNTLQY
jgi:hypothetical protein